MKEEIKAGIIIVSALLMLTVIVVLVGGSSLYGKTDTYTVKVMNSAGLEPGSQVRLGGVKVGRVQNIKGPDGPGRPVTIEIGVTAGTTLYQGTTALVTQIGFVGDIYLLLSVNKASGAVIKPGSEIPAEVTIGFAEIMTRLDGLAQNVDGLVKDVDKLFSPKNVAAMEKLVFSTNDAIVRGTVSIEKMAATLKGTADKLGVILDEIDGLVKSNKGEIAQVIKKAREDLEKAGKMIEGMEEAARSVTKTTGSVDRAVEAQSRNIGNLIDTMNRTTEDLQEILQEIKSKPWSVIYQERRDD